jgi:5-formyltetrahydrofolate cyclo-ligase
MLLTVSNEKKELRKNLLVKLLSLTGEELKRRSQNVEKRLSNLPIYKQAKLVMVYYPLKGEVDILQMVRRDLGLKRFCFPFMNLERKELEVYEVNNLEGDFSFGPFGVMQPRPDTTKRVDIKEIDMVVVPALAFDRNKNRLGRGAGFYDRFLKRLNPSCRKVGIAFEPQVLDDLPIHPSHDQKVDVIVSEDFCV